MSPDLVKPLETAGPDKPKDISGSESDVEKGTGEVVITTEYVVDPVLEKKLLWKFDRHILPLLAIMYLFK